MTSRKRVPGERFNPSNEPHTCLWCGWKLHERFPGHGLGRWGRDSFCTGMCAEYFAHRAAELGYRFNPRKQAAQ